MEAIIILLAFAVWFSIPDGEDKSEMNSSVRYEKINELDKTLKP